VTRSNLKVVVARGRGKAREAIAKWSGELQRTGMFAPENLHCTGELPIDSLGSPWVIRPFKR